LKQNFTACIYLLTAISKFGINKGKDARDLFNGITYNLYHK